MTEQELARAVGETLQWAADQCDLPILTGVAFEDDSNVVEVEANFGEGRFKLTVERLP